MLPADWLSSMENIQNFPVYAPTGEEPRQKDPLYKQGYGLKTV
jgi:hypothetical protein